MKHYGRHCVDQKDIDTVIEVLQSDWLTCGPLVEKFEDALAQKVNSQHAISCSNGTTALHLALLALDIRPEDAVLVPAITFLASANAVRYIGAKVIFVDVDSNTGLVTPETLEAAVVQNKNASIKAFINVHLAGQCENLEEIYKIARKYNLFVVEDAAHAIGTLYLDQTGKQSPVGSNSFSDITTFSFHPVKTIAMGEGGALTTNDTDIANKLRLLRSHGMVREFSQWQNKDQGFDNKTNNPNPWYYEMNDLGYNYRISDINCALGLSQLNKIDDFIERRHHLTQRYDNAFLEAENLTSLKKLPSSLTAWHLYILHMNFENLNKSRAEVMKALARKSIGAQVHYIPLYRQPYYQNLYGVIQLEGAEEFYKTCLSLPLFVGLTNEQQDYIIEALKNL
jgi:UDP-4-amino-4,6-dideoxy-N-acetyl-beta-L-altrosamine transaminase